MVEKRRIGIIGGTFNPIHLGHLMIAEVARESFHLEKVIFVPARIPPHKHNDVIDAKHRYAMTAAAVADNPYFEISDVEMRREGPSYTIDTIHHFNAARRWFRTKPCMPTVLRCGSSAFSSPRFFRMSAG